jgi:hypothetical protein
MFNEPNLNKRLYCFLVYICIEAYDTGLDPLNRKILIGMASPRELPEVVCEGGGVIISSPQVSQLDENAILT